MRTSLLALAVVFVVAVFVGESHAAVFFNSDYDGHPSDPTFNYRASGGGVEGTGSYSVQNDPDGVALPGTSTVRKVVRFDVDSSDTGGSTCPPRARLQFDTGKTAR